MSSPWFPSLADLAELGFEPYNPWHPRKCRRRNAEAPHFRMKAREDRVLVRLNLISLFRLVQTTPISTPRFDDWPGCVFTGHVANAQELKDLLQRAKWIQP